MNNPFHNVIMDPSIASLSHAIFGASNRTQESRIRSQAEGIIEQLVVYTWPKDVKQEDKLAFLSMFTAYGRSSDPSPSAWATWAFSYIILCFPEFETSIKVQAEREYRFKQLPKRFVEEMVRLLRAGEDYSESQPEEYGRVLHDVEFPPGLPDLPRTAVSFPPNLAASCTVQVVYGYCALLLFLSGKKITEKNYTAITDRRPMNLVNAFSINEYSSYVLNGNGKMLTDAHHNINQAWNTYAGARIAIITEVAAFAAGTSIPQRVVYTVTKMLEHSGMQPAAFIHEFLQAMPQCVNYSCIRPSLNAYISSIREVAAAPAHLQPYYKLIHGDSTRAFHRNSILVLSSCAVTWKKYTSPSMVNFRLGEGATAAVGMYDAEAARKGHPTLQDLTVGGQAEEETE